MMITTSSLAKRRGIELQWLSGTVSRCSDGCGGGDGGGGRDWLDFAQLELPKIAEYRESGTFVELPKARAAELMKVA